MRSNWSICAIACALCLPIAALARQFPSVFAGVRAQVASSSPVPLLLPTVIPSVVAKHGIKKAVVASTNRGYAVSFYYSNDASDASYAGMISGSTKIFVSLPNNARVRLASGTVALFRPVQCGGACAPANLWWQSHGFEYSLQLALPSTLNVSLQRQAMLKLANSMARVK